MSFGGQHGYAINPARDFGPRLFTVVAGFKNNGLTDGGFIFWVPIVGPLVGGADRRRGVRFRRPSIPSALCQDSLELASLSQFCRARQLLRCV